MLMYIKILKNPQRHVKSCHKAAREAARLLRISTVLAHRFSRCVFRTSSNAISNTWETVKNANSQASLQTY